MRVVLIAALSLAGCKAREEAAPTRARDAAPVAPSTPLEVAYVAVAACDAKALYLDPCPEEDALDFVDADEATRRAAALKMLRHASRRVRLAAFERLRPYATAADAPAVTAAVTEERDVEIAGAMARTVPRYATERPELVALALRLADDARPEVRRGVIGHGLSDLRGVAGVHEALEAHARTDPDREARHAACEALGKLGDPRAFAVLAELSQQAADPYLADACALGMVELWFDERNASEAAYRHTLAFVDKGPRMPDEQLGAVIYLGELREAMEDAPADWAGKPWVKVAEAEAALVAMAKDVTEHPRDRQSAVTALINAGVSRDTLRAIRDTVPDAVDDESDLFYLGLVLDDALGKRR